VPSRTWSAGEGERGVLGPGLGIGSRSSRSGGKTAPETRRWIATPHRSATAARSRERIIRCCNPGRAPLAGRCRAVHDSDAARGYACKQQFVPQVCEQQTWTVPPVSFPAPRWTQQQCPQGGLRSAGPGPSVRLRRVATGSAALDALPPTLDGGHQHGTSAGLSAATALGYSTGLQHSATALGCHLPGPSTLWGPRNRGPACWIEIGGIRVNASACCKRSGYAPKVPTRRSCKGRGYLYRISYYCIQ
jgi:hypothetical protein